MERASGRSVKPAAELARGVTAQLRCPTHGWRMYAHDAQRSGSTLSCCHGPLAQRWRFDPSWKAPRKARVFHAIASKDSVYASGVIGESPAVFALSLDGKLNWTFDSHVDITHHEWPAYVLDRVVLNDDGLYILDPRTGETEVDRGMDSWGQVIDDGKNLFATNRWYVAGPKTYVGALEVGGAPLWKHHEYGMVKEDVMDRFGGIALANERLIFSPNYHPNPGAGIYAYRAKDGAPLWSVGTMPTSHLSIAGESSYAFEHPDIASQQNLVARNVESGAVRWSVHVKSPENSPPVVALGNALFRAEGGAVVAVRRGDGTEAWRAALNSPEATDVGWATSLAAATGSGTLVAVDGKDLVVLTLADGSVEWRGHVENAKGPIHSPVIAGGRVYVSDGNGVIALDCK